FRNFPIVQLHPHAEQAAEAAEAAGAQGKFWEMYERLLQPTSGLDLDADVRQSIARIKASPFIPHKDSVRGFVYEVETGRLREVKD
ncbi:MAG: hypothetical protein ACRDOB_08200, partial [Streptosporangiaceae bacterium]